MKYYKLLKGIYANKVVFVDKENHYEYCIGQEKLIETNIFANYIWPEDPEFEQFQEITKEQAEELILYERMKLLELLEIAKKTATAAHKGQVDIGGQPYINHPEFVADSVNGLEQKIIAWLHDVLEDTELTEEDLKLLGFTDAIINSVKTLTRNRKVDYQEYLWKVKRDIRAKEVKIADLTHNLDASRLGRKPKKRDKERLEKYKKALDYLQDKEEI